MSRCINKRKFNHQKATRRRHSLAKAAFKVKTVLNPQVAVPLALQGDSSAVVNFHQRQAKNSNPRAVVKLSAKKLKQIKKRARIVTAFVRTLFIFT